MSLSMRRRVRSISTGSMASTRGPIRRRAINRLAYTDHRKWSILASPGTTRRWRGLGLSDYVIYELHVGTFTPSGTLAAIIEHLPALVELGITAIELMPLAQFPGSRNWGYDGVHPYSVQNTYGEPRDLQQLVSACHAQGLAVVLDVVYNHLGPEGNYLADFGHYFTGRYHTSWGKAINYDGPDSDAVRQFFIENALYWVRESHIDALRLDAIPNHLRSIGTTVSAPTYRRRAHLRPGVKSSGLPVRRNQCERSARGASG